MAERSLKGTWKGRGGKVSKTSSLMTGWIYTGDNITGILIEDLGEVVILRTKEKEDIKVLKKSLKIVAPE